MATEPTAPALTGNETPNDIKTDYSRSTSPTFSSWQNRDHQIIKAALQKAGLDVSGGVSPTNAIGRFVGRDFTQGRAQAGNGLELLLPDSIYSVDGAVVTLESVGGLAVIGNVPANKANGVFAFASKTDSGGVEVLPANFVEAGASGAPLAAPPSGLACLGLFKTDANGITAADYRYTDEIQTANVLLQEIQELKRAFASLGTSNPNPGTGDPVGGVTVTLAGDNSPWESSNPSGPTIKAAVENLIGESENRLKQMILSGTSKTIQTDNDHFVEALTKIWAALVRISPESHDLVEGAMVVFGFAGHSVDGDFAKPGINGTQNFLRYTTLEVNTPARLARPGS